MQRAATRRRSQRVAQASVDYVLILAIILPMVGFLLWAVPWIVRLAYEMVCVLISWPFL